MKYRKVSVYIWNDEKFSTLTDDAKLLFLFILTHPHMTSVGSMRSSVYGLSAELNWTINKTQKGFNELFRNGLVNHNERACCILLPNFIKHNPPENPNVVKSWSNALELVPECDLKKHLVSLLNQHVNTMTEPYQNAFKTVLEGYGKPFGKGMAKQEQEQEQERTTVPLPGESGCETNGYSDESKTFVGNFISYIKTTHPKQAPKSKNLEENSLEEVDKLIRLDGFELEYIRTVIGWAVKDDFWSNQVFSLAGLRKKSNSGLTKFQNISAAYEKEHKQPEPEEKIPVFKVVGDD